MFHKQILDEYKRIPTKEQIKQLFSKNGFHINHVISNPQLYEFLDRQYTKNNFMNQINQAHFNKVIFEQIWQNMQILSQGTVKIQNVCSAMHEALILLTKKLQIIDSAQGLQKKQQLIKQLCVKQNQLQDQLSQEQGLQNYQRCQKLKKQIHNISIYILKLQYQHQQLVNDKKSFSNQLSILKNVLGQVQAIPINQVQNKTHNLLIQLFKPQYKLELGQLCYLAFVGIGFEMLLLTHRLSFFTILAFIFVLYILFIGYYDSKSVTYTIIWMFVTIIFDIAYISLQIFTNLIIMPIIYNGNSFLKYVDLIFIIISIVLRAILVVKLLEFKETPHKIYYFVFWGQQIRLNRRSKNLDQKI